MRRARDGRPGVSETAVFRGGRLWNRPHSSNPEGLRRRGRSMWRTRSGRAAC